MAGYLHACADSTHGSSGAHRGRGATTSPWIFPSLYEHLTVSLRRILLGALVGVVTGLLLGVVLCTVSWIRVMLEPLVTFVRALPPLAYFSLFVI